MNNMVTAIKTADKDVDVVKLLLQDVETIAPVKTKYQIMYIKECSKKVKDLDWVLKNKSKFPKMSNSQVFGLTRLREKLSEENALPF